MLSRVLPCLVWICLLTAWGCDDASQQAQRSPAEAQQEQAPALNQSQLVHLVWLKLKEDASDQDVDALFGEIKKLAAIEEVNGLEMGSFHDLGDARAMSDLDVVMQMRFDSQEDYQTYQAHPIHLQLKSDLVDYLSAPPVTYDYWSK